MWSICKKELNQFFSNLTGYIAILLFLLINGIFLFVLQDSSIFEYGYAGLDKFFDLAPWVLLFLVPAITMRSLSDEFKSGTFELLQTRPLKTSDIVIGKYISILIILLFVIVPTLLYVLTIKSLSVNGIIDTGGIAGSYLGLFLLGAVYAAISLCCSGFTGNAVVAFLSSAFLCLILYFGFNAISKLPLLQGNVDYYIEMLGIDFHYRSISRGVLDSRDMVYFLSVIIFFILITIKNIRRSRFWLSPVFLLLVIINWLTSVWHTRIDLTNEKRFTLSNSSKKILKKTNEHIKIDVFLKGNYPSGFKKLSSATDDFLRETKEIAGNKIEYNFISPEDKIDGTDRSYADTLSAMGLFPINMTSQVKEGQQQSFVYPYALVYYKDKVAPVQLYKGKSPMINFSELNSAEAMIEYNIVNTIAKITREEKPVIGYATGNGEPVGFETYDLVENAIKPDYNFYTLDLSSQPSIPADFKALLMVKPKNAFTDVEKLKLDQYVMNGGKLILFVDELNAEMDSLQIKNEVIAYDRGLNLSDQLFRYGVRINTDLLMDLQCDYLPFDVNGDGQFDLLPWNYFPVLESSGNHPINKNLGFVSGRFVNSIDTIDVEGIKKTILLHSSVNARKIATPALISGKENVTAAEDEKFQLQNVPVAVLLEGKFRSFFSNRLSTAMNDSLQQNGDVFVSQCIKDNKMIVVSDGDIVLNSFIKNQPIPMGMNQFTYGSQREFPFANRDFLLNCLDYLVNENGLNEAKSKDYVLHLLDTKKVNTFRSFWQLINIALPSLFVVIFAMVFQFIRKRRYSA